MAGPCRLGLDEEFVAVLLQLTARSTEPTATLYTDPASDIRDTTRTNSHSTHSCLLMI